MAVGESCHDEWFFKVNATFDHLTKPSNAAETPRYRLQLFDRVNSPDKLQEYFANLAVSDLTRTGIDHRRELNESLSNLTRLIVRGIPAYYAWHPRLKETLMELILTRLRNLRTGWWGETYVRNGHVEFVDDLSVTFHVVAYLLGLWPLGVVLVFELLSGFLAIECPIDRDAISVGSPVPGAGFRPENPDLAESALPQTLLGKEADLQFRLIQPTSVYRRVVNGEPIPQRPTLFLAEAVRQRLLGVGTQVVHDQMDGLRRGIAVGDGLDEVCKFQRRPGRGDLRKVSSCLRFDAAEYIGSSSTFVFIVALGHAARFHGQGFSDIVVKSHRLFIYAHHRLFGRQRPFIDFQHIFHRLDVFVIELGDAPHFFPATAEGRVLATRSELSRVLPWGPVCV